MLATGPSTKCRLKVLLGILGNRKCIIIFEDAPSVVRSPRCLHVYAHFPISAWRQAHKLARVGICLRTVGTHYIAPSTKGLLLTERGMTVARTGNFKNLDRYLQSWKMIVSGLRSPRLVDIEIYLPCMSSSEKSKTSSVFLGLVKEGVRIDCRIRKAFYA